MLLERRGVGLRMMSSAAGDSVVDGMVKKLQKEFSPVKLEVIPAYGDPNGSHVTITVVSNAFEGKRPVQRQQLVYKVRWVARTIEFLSACVNVFSLMVGHAPEEGDSNSSRLCAGVTLTF